MLSAILCVSFFASCDPLDNKERIEKYRKEIADLQSKIADKEVEIVRLSPVKEVEYLFLPSPKPGTAGKFGTLIYFVGGSTEKTTATLRIETITDDKTMILSLGTVENGKFSASTKQIYVSNCTTDGLTEGITFRSLTYRVLGTKIIDGRVYVHVEPYTPKKK